MITLSFFSPAVRNSCQELGPTSPVVLAVSSDNLKAFAMSRHEGVAQYVLVFGSGDDLPPAGLLAETSIAPQPSMAPHAALQGGPAYDLLVTSRAPQVTTPDPSNSTPCPQASAATGPGPGRSVSGTERSTIRL